MRRKKYKFTTLDDSDKPAEEKEQYNSGNEFSFSRRHLKIVLVVIAVLIMAGMVFYVYYQRNGMPFLKDKGTIYIGVIEDDSAKIGESHVIKKVFTHAKGSQGNKIKVTIKEVSNAKGALKQYAALRQKTACIFVLSDDKDILNVFYRNANTPVIIPYGEPAKNKNCFNFNFTANDQIKLIADYSIFIKKESGIGVLYDPGTNQLAQIKLLRKYLKNARKSEGQIKHTEAYTTETDDNLDSQFKRFSDDDISTVYMPNIHKKQIPALIKNTAQYHISVVTDANYRKYITRYPCENIYFVSCYQRDREAIRKKMKKDSGSTDEHMCLIYESADMVAKCLKHGQSFNLYWTMHKSRYTGLCNSLIFGNDGLVHTGAGGNNPRGFVVRAIPENS